MNSIASLASVPHGAGALRRQLSQIIDAERQLAAARAECVKRLSDLAQVEQELWSWLGDKMEFHDFDFDSWWRDAVPDEVENARELLETIHGRRLSRPELEHAIERQWLDVRKDLNIAAEPDR